MASSPNCCSGKSSEKSKFQDLNSEWSLCSLLLPVSFYMHLGNQDDNLFFDLMFPPLLLELIEIWLIPTPLSSRNPSSPVPLANIQLINTISVVSCFPPTCPCHVYPFLAPSSHETDRLSCSPIHLLHFLAYCAYQQYESLLSNESSPQLISIISRSFTSFSL